MTKQKSTKRALLASGIALFMCISLFVGSTFAWFTDSAKTGVNTIQAGTLDIVLEYQDANGNWKDAEGKTLSFKAADGRENILWEPGCTYELPAIRVRNNGNLALKYEIYINGTTGDAKLLEAIEFTANDAAISAFSGNLNAKDDSSAPIVIKGHMKETAGNEYQGLSADGIGITVYATQYTYESDSIGNQYDAAATFLNKDENGNWLITSVSDLLYLAKQVNGGNNYQGETIILANDIDLNGMKWEPIGSKSKGFSGTFDGQNNTISNFKVEEEEYAGLFGYALNGGNFKNLTVKGATIKATDRAGALLGAGYTDVVNCHAIDCNVTVTPALQANGEFDGGAKAGGVVGQLFEGAGMSIVGCTAKNVKVVGYRDIGAVLGMAHNNNTVTDCKAYDSEVMATYLEPGQKYDGNTPNENVGEVVGRRNPGVVETGTEFSNVTKGVYVYGMTLVSSGTNSEIIVNDKEGFLNLTKLSADWRELFTDGNGAAYTNYANGAGSDYYYSSYWTIRLNADIDLNNDIIDPVKLWVGESTGEPTFDGNNYTIRNAKIVMDGTTENEAGLFDAAKCIVKNLKLDNIHVTGSNIGNSTAGILSGSVNANQGVQNITITNSSVTGGKYTGGVIGYGYTDILNCTLTNVTVKGGYKLGGLIGYICASSGTGDVTGNTLTNCTVKGNDGIYAGGKDKYIIGRLVGNYNCDGTVNNNTVTNMTTETGVGDIGEIESGKNITGSVTVSSAQGLQNALENTNNGEIVLGGDVDLNDLFNGL